MVKWLRHQPLTLVSRVQIPVESPLFFIIRPYGQQIISSQSAKASWEMSCIRPSNNLLTLIGIGLESGL